MIDIVRGSIEIRSVGKKSSELGEMLSGRTYLCDEKGLHDGIVVNIYSDGRAEAE